MGGNIELRYRIDIIFFLKFEEINMHILEVFFCNLYKLTFVLRLSFDDLCKSRKKMLTLRGFKTSCPILKLIANG